MTLSLLFWILMLLWAVVGGFSAWKSGCKPAIGGAAFMFALLVMLGWQVFGAPIK